MLDCNTATCAQFARARFSFDDEGDRELGRERATEVEGDKRANGANAEDMKTHVTEVAMGEKLFMGLYPKAVVLHGIVSKPSYLSILQLTPRSQKSASNGDKGERSKSA